MLLAKFSTRRLELALFSLERLGFAPLARWRGHPFLLFTMHRLLGLGWVYTQLDFVPLSAELKRTRFEPGGGGFEFDKVHSFCVCV